MAGEEDTAAGDGRYDGGADASEYVGAVLMGYAAVVRCGGGAETVFTSGCAGRTGEGAGEGDDAGTSSTVRSWQY